MTFLPPKLGRLVLAVLVVVWVFQQNAEGAPEAPVVVTEYSFREGTKRMCVSYSCPLPSNTSTIVGTFKPDGCILIITPPDASTLADPFSSPEMWPHFGLQKGTCDFKWGRKSKNHCPTGFSLAVEKPKSSLDFIASHPPKIIKSRIDGRTLPIFPLSTQEISFTVGEGGELVYQNVRLQAEPEGKDNENKDREVRLVDNVVEHNQADEDVHITPNPRNELHCSKQPTERRSLKSSKRGSSHQNMSKKNSLDADDEGDIAVTVDRKMSEAMPTEDAVGLRTDDTDYTGGEASELDPSLVSPEEYDAGTLHLPGLQAEEGDGVVSCRRDETEPLSNIKTTDLEKALKKKPRRSFRGKQNKRKQQRRQKASASG